jgi:hypothetical protein
MRYWTGVLVILCFAFAGCDQTSLVSRFGSPSKEKLATSYIELLRDHQYGQIEKDIDPSLQTPGLHQALVTMAEVMPRQPPVSIKVVGVHTVHGPGFYKSNYTFEYQYADRWLLINVAVQKKNGLSTIIGFNVNTLPDSLEATNRFTLAGKHPLQYLVLAGAVAVPLFILYALVACIRTPVPKRKWLWILFILLGVCTFSVDWTTGQWSLKPVSVLLFGAAATRPVYGAWTLSIALPLGAIWFLARRPRFLQAGTQPVVPPELPKAYE